MSPRRTIVTVSKPRCGCCGKPGTTSPWYMRQPSLPSKSWPRLRPGERRGRAHAARCPPGTRRRGGRRTGTGRTSARETRAAGAGRPGSRCMVRHRPIGKADPSRQSRRDGPFKTPFAQWHRDIAVRAFCCRRQSRAAQRDEIARSRAAHRCCSALAQVRMPLCLLATRHGLRRMTSHQDAGD